MSRMHKVACHLSFYSLIPGRKRRILFITENLRTTHLVGRVYSVILIM